MATLGLLRNTSLKQWLLNVRIHTKIRILAGDFKCVLRNKAVW